METNERGNTVTRNFSPGNRYRFDFGMCSRENGWVQYDTDQDAPYFGVWVHPGERKIITYAEGDVDLIECVSEESYHAELKDMAEFYGPPSWAFKAYGNDGSTVTEYYDTRPE